MIVKCESILSRVFVPVLLFLFVMLSLVMALILLAFLMVLVVRIALMVAGASAEVHTMTRAFGSDRSIGFEKRL